MAAPHPMLRALALARRGLGYVEPNPLVGCVLVRDGKTIGEGFHQKFGGPHAEVNALSDCARRGINPAGCDVYVTLEPCCHFGKTPPCTDALIHAQVGRVVVAMLDPFPLVAGSGIAQLRKAGVRVEIGTHEEAARELNRPFIKRVTAGLPWVIAKWAQTVDGYVATASGDSKWITNDASRAYVHEIRGRADAIIVGIGTALADDPLLTARPSSISGKKTLAPPRVARRVVVDPDIKLPVASKLVRSLPIPLTLAVRQSWLKSRPKRMIELQKRGVDFIGLSALQVHPHRLALRALLRHLAKEHAATNVVIEGGPRLMASFFEQRLVDQALVFVAPKLLGDAGAKAAIEGTRVQAIRDARQLKLQGTRLFGEDVMLDYHVPRKKSSGDSPR